MMEVKVIRMGVVAAAVEESIFIGHTFQLGMYIKPVAIVKGNISIGSCLVYLFLL